MSYKDFEKGHIVEMLISERDSLKAEVTRLSGKTGFCTQCEAYAKEIDALNVEVEIERSRADANFKSYDRIKKHLSETLAAIKKLDETPVYDYGQTDRQGNKPGIGKRWKTPKELADEAIKASSEAIENPKHGPGTGCKCTACETWEA